MKALKASHRSKSILFLDIALWKWEVCRSKVMIKKYWLKNNDIAKCGLFQWKLKKMGRKQLPLVTATIQPWLITRIFEALVILAKSGIKLYLTEKSVNFLVTIKVQENWHNFHSVITSNHDGISTWNFMQHNYVFE